MTRTGGSPGRRPRRGSTISRSRRLTTAVGLAVVLGLGLLAGQPASAVSPTPPAIPTPTDEPLPTGPVVLGRAWLDQPLPTTAAAGSTIHVGVVVVGDEDRGLVGGVTLRVRLFPATGTAAPTQANGVQDWAGHYNATVVVPVGGPGRLEVSLPGSFCNDSGCIEQPFLFDPVEPGPPEGVALPLVATATIAVGTSTVAAHVPATVLVDLQPRVAWPAPGLDLPPTLVAQARVPQGPVLTEVELTRQGEGGHYEGSIKLDELGEVVLQAATTRDPTPDDLFGTGLVRVRVVASTASLSPTAGAGFGGLPEWLPAALAAAALVLAAVLVVGGRMRADR